MTDIVIYKRRDRAVITATSEQGDRWIRANMSRRSGEPALVINSEFAEEWAAEVRKDGLIVEVG